MSLPLLAIHTAHLLSNIMKYDCYGNEPGTLYRNSLFSILKCTRSIPEVHAAVYSLSALDWENVPG